MMKTITKNVIANYLVCHIIMMLVILCSLSSMVRSQADSCDSNYIHPERIKFDATSLRQCLNIWDSHSFILRYGEASPKLWSFLLSFPTSINSYGAIGFSKNGSMVGSGAKVTWMDLANGVGVIGEYYLGGKTQDKVVLGKGDPVWTNYSGYFTASTAYMAFQLQLLNDEVPPSYLIFAVGPDGFFPSRPDYLLAKHIDHYAISFDYSPGKLSNQQEAKKNEGTLNIAGLSGLMIIIGATYLFYY